MKLLENLRRPDWLAELQAVAVAGIVVVLAFGVVAIANDLRGPVELPLPATGVTGDVEHGLRDGAAVAAHQDLRVTVAEPSVGQRVGAVLQHLPTGVVVLALLVLLFRLVRHARHSDPFTRQTVTRLRVLAFVAFIGGYGAVVVEFWAEFLLSETMLAAGITGRVSFPLYWFLVFFGLLAVAEVVNRGCVMRDELDTVV